MSNNENETKVNSGNAEIERQNTQTAGQASETGTVAFNLDTFEGTQGTDGSDYIYDPSASEIIGLKGNDTIYGARNDNSYYYRSGDGNDSIVDFGGNDKLVFTNLNLADITFERSGRYGVVIRITETDKTITLNYQEYSARYALESIEFADGTSMSASDISAALPAPTFNVAPVVNDVDLGAVDEDSTMIITSAQLLANSTDANNDELTVRYAYLSYADRSKATLTLLEDGTWQVTPNENFNGEKLTIHYVVTDGQFSRSATATFNVSAVNDAAVANDDSFTKVSNELLTITAASLVANDTDIDGDELTVTAISNVVGAIVTLNDDGTISVDTNPDYSGEASFTYTIIDAAGAPSTATVSINVLLPGEFNLDAFEGKQGSTGNDYLRANYTGGDIIGLEGNDRIIGSRADDTYFYRSGDGNDTIYDYRGNDRLKLVDLELTDITISRSGRWDTVITINETEEQITLKYQSYYKSLDTIEFASGETLNITEELSALPINGSENRDYLYGTSEDDTINALAGNDYLSGAAGDDTLNGGEGNDYVSGGAGDDQLNGDAGNDKLYGGYGNDILSGGEGNDYLSGSLGNNTLNGGAGDDRLYSSSGDDALNGGAGNDYLYARFGSNTLNGGEGDDTLVIGSKDNTLTFEDVFGNDTVYYFEAGDASDDVINFEGIELLSDFTEVMAALTQQGSDTLISTADSSVLLKNVELEQLNEADFIFG